MGASTPPKRPILDRIADAFWVTAMVVSFTLSGRNRRKGGR